jgi:uncharacterized repeat protein (TIGR01451 family)
MSALRSFRQGRLRRARRIGTVSVLIVVGLLFVSAAQAVHDNGMFELDGNTVHNSATTPPYDWNSLFGATGNKLITPDPINGPLLADVFVSDAAKPDQTYFTSNKDIQPIASGQQHWGCDPINNPLDKDDLQNAYAALVQVPANAPDNAGHQVLYLGSERGSNNGTSFAGFWLLKDKNVGCSGTNDFSGQHTDGDLLIVSDYTNGGGTQDVSVYKWVGNDATGSPVLQSSFNGSICSGSLSNDNACAIANSATITTPWSPTSHDSNTFVETGIDLTTLLGSSGGCFTTFLAETRSSAEITATLKDFAGGSFSTCVTPPISTTATPGGSSNPLGVANQHDVATISAVGGHPSPTGTMTFFLCNPSQVTAGGCVSGGTQVGSPVTISSGSATSANASGSLTTTVGKYCWRAEYTPDSDGAKFYVAGSHTDPTDECFTVIKASPSIVTTPSETSGSVGDLLNDSASLTGGSNFDGTGTITFNLYGPSDPNCDGTPAYTETVTADHNSPPDYVTSNSTVTADTAGTWNWTADFSGDGNNNSTSSGCGEESVVINGAAIHILKTADAAQVNAGDSIGFTLTVWNSGLGDAKGVTLSDTLPTNAGLDWSIDSQGAGWNGTCAIASGVLSCGPVTVPAGTTQGASTFTVHIVSDTTTETGGDCEETGLVDNTGTVDTTNDGSDESSAEICVAGPAIHIVKTADAAQVSAGDPIGFTMTVWNSGIGDATGVTLSDTLPTNAGLDWSIDAQGAGWAGSCAIAAGVLSCGPVTVPAGTTQAASTFTVHIVSDTTGATGGDCQETGLVDNTGSVDTTNDGSDESSDQICVAAPAIHIAKTADAATVNVGDPIGFTLTVWNDGPGDAHDVTLNDVLPTSAGLSWSIDAQGAGWNSSCAITAGVLTCGPVTVPAGTTQQASTFTVHITSATTGATGGDCPTTGVVNNTGDVTTSNDGSDESSASTCVQALVDLTVTKSGSPATQELNPGSLITWTMVVTNNGPSTATGVVVSDPMPAGNTFVSASASPHGTCTGGAILSCNLGTMAAGEHVTITLVTKPSAVGIQTNTVTVGGDRPETNTGNNSATATVEVVGTPTPPKPCIAVTKVTPKQLFVGRKTTVKIQLRQGGQAVKGIHVRIKGPKLNLRTKASNSKGVVKQTLKMKKAGILVFTPIASKACNTKRVGVTNVFTPPVTG